ncbi:disulfide bond formation protein B [Ferrimonas balearica]|uniref:disulfide bond formation protein B n=1 Tax=Ferrimonas balearica TaxID=44012 RepID=UPI001C5A56A5|nr:disulfide bond formation protein B [Ferrimonas balearica]MBW3138598.1 disulfide bond formation protein B [Ferrimonas balearica]MBY6105659.1 disulfide bond formation protein B [Ferrimonas balearica]
MQARDAIFNKLASFASVVIMALPVGIACFIFGFLMKDNPCAFCWQERTAMILVALTALYIVRFGLKPKYIGALVWLGIYGAWMATVHTSINLGSDIGQGFSVKIMGAHTYTWALLVFVVVLVVVAALMMFLGNRFPGKPTQTPGNPALVKVVASVFLFVISGNIVQAFTQTGPPPFVGQDSPGRVSFNPKFMSWELDHWPTYGPDARGAYAISDPSYDQVNSTSAMFDGAALPVSAKQALPAAISSRITAIDYEPVSQRYAVVTSDMWVYILDNSLSRILTQAKIDGMYMIHISPLAGVAFTSENELVVLGDNKAFAKLVLQPDQTWEVNYRRFNESTDGIGESERGQFATVRAKLSYAAALAYDKDAEQLVTVTAANERGDNLVASRFALEDMTLSAEANFNLGDKQDRWMANLPMLTGYAIDGPHSFLLSGSAGEVLMMNTETGAIDHGIRLATPANPQGLVKVGNNLMTVAFDNGVNTLYRFEL